MYIDLDSGTYVVAVSGGVDSMVLLDVLRRREDLKLIVAHFDHGMRPDSMLDRQLVEETAKRHGLTFVFDRVELGVGASESLARTTRYNFLHRVLEASKARAIITAHHQGDLIETAVLNFLRGTGRKGLGSIRSTEVIKRPLLHVRKTELVEYARTHNLIWQEDATNQDTQYLRNYIRHRIIPRFNAAQREKFLEHIHDMRRLNAEIDGHITNHLHLHPAVDKLHRAEFIRLPHAVSKEILAAWLRRHGIRQFDQKLLQRLVIGAKTLRPGKRLDIDARHFIMINRATLSLEVR